MKHLLSDGHAKCQTKMTPNFQSLRDRIQELSDRAEVARDKGNYELPDSPLADD